MPRNQKANKQLQEASRQKILMAAFELFASRGYATTTVDCIAKKAGVSKGLIYHYFNSKQDILKGIFHWIVRDAEQYMDPSADLSPKAFCRWVIDYSFDFIINQTKINRLIVGLAIQPHVVQQLKEEIDAVREQWTNRLIAVLKELGYAQPKAEAYFLGALFDGIGIGYMTLGTSYPIDEVKALLLKRYDMYL